MLSRAFVCYQETRQNFSLPLVKSPNSLSSGLVFVGSLPSLVSARDRMKSRQRKHFTVFVLRDFTEVSKCPPHPPRPPSQCLPPDSVHLCWNENTFSVVQSDYIMDNNLIQDEATNKPLISFDSMLFQERMLVECYLFNLVKQDRAHCSNAARTKATESWVWQGGPCNLKELIKKGLGKIKASRSAFIAAPFP